jgi:hypothetical protein
LLLGFGGPALLVHTLTRGPGPLPGRHLSGTSGGPEGEGKDTRQGGAYLRQGAPLGVRRAVWMSSAGPVAAREGLRRAELAK